jgi:uncharacterized protein (DUF58 family)
MKRHDFLLLGATLLFFLSFRLSFPAFRWFAVMLVLWTLMIYHWPRFISRFLHGSIHIKPKRMFPGEEVHGEVVISNQSFIPVLGVRITFAIRNLVTVRSDYFTEYEEKYLSNLKHYHGTFNIGGRETMRIPITITSSQRGLFMFRELILSFQDPFGLERIERRFPLYEELIVYPNEREVRGLQQVEKIPQGDTIVKRWIQEDIFFPAGSRPYQQSDPLSRIDFKSTAKTGVLHTKIYDFTAHGELCVIANLLTSPNQWQINEETFERTVSLVARLARDSYQKKLRFSLFMNARILSGNRVFELPAGSGRNHYIKTLEVLARLSYVTSVPFYLALQKVKEAFPNGCQAIVLTSYVDDEMKRELNLLAKKGFEIYLIDPEQGVPRLTRWIYGERVDFVG